MITQRSVCVYYASSDASDAVYRNVARRLDADMWQVVAEPEDVPDALANAPEWSAAAREFAQVS